jgi:hypothetical protein
MRTLSRFFSQSWRTVSTKPDGSYFAPRVSEVERTAGQQNDLKTLLETRRKPESWVNALHLQIRFITPRITATVVALPL